MKSSKASGTICPAALVDSYAKNARSSAPIPLARFDACRLNLRSHATMTKRFVVTSYGSPSVGWTLSLIFIVSLFQLSGDVAYPGAAGEGDLGLDGGAKRRERSDCEVGDRDSAIEVGVPGGERLEPFIGRLELRACAGCEEAGLPRRKLS